MFISFRLMTGYRLSAVADHACVSKGPKCKPLQATRTVTQTNDPNDPLVIDDNQFEPAAAR
jgi:hypothetical protein